MEKFEAAFPHNFLQGDYLVGFLPKIVDEIDIIKIESVIRDKPNWEKKIKDPLIISKWRQEAQEMRPKIDKSDSKIDFALKELEWVVETRDKKTGIEVSTVDGTFHSDTLIEESLRQELIEAVTILEDVQEGEKDWHPGSNNQVLNLVHPSLFPLVIGKSPVLKVPYEPQPRAQQGNGSDVNYSHLLYFATKDEIMEEKESEELALSHTLLFPDYSKSSKYQWLPSDVQIDESGNAHFLSYINNLHPEKQPKMYSCLEKLLSRFVSMFEMTLTALRHPRENRIILTSVDWYEEIILPDADDSDYDESDSLEKIFKPMPIPEFEKPPVPENHVKLNGRKLQVIVKLANIHLNPNKPEYEGGVWHLEGMANERIVGSGIYYYSCENITESRLEFRQAIQEPDYEQYDDTGLNIIYDLRDNEPMNQYMGSILTKEQRCIGFPNTLQHKVAPFKLEDPTRPGHRKILVFFLVDPTIRILSTVQVPAQQGPWFTHEMDKTPTPVPELVVHKIVGMLNWPISIDDAKRKRDELMEERKFFVKSSNESLFERPFSLCEH